MGGVTALPAAGGSPKEGRKPKRGGEREENISPVGSRHSFPPLFHHRPITKSTQYNPPPPQCSDREALGCCSIHLQGPTCKSRDTNSPASFFLFKLDSSYGRTLLIPHFSSLPSSVFVFRFAFFSKAPILFFTPTSCAISTSSLCGKCVIVFFIFLRRELISAQKVFFSPRLAFLFSLSLALFYFGT